jgi:hypothetical protein
MAAVVAITPAAAATGTGSKPNRLKSYTSRKRWNSRGRDAASSQCESSSSRKRRAHADAGHRATEG